MVMSSIIRMVLISISGGCCDSMIPWIYKFINSARNSESPARFFFNPDKNYPL